MIITISSEKSLFSQVLAMIILFILPSYFYHTPIPHKLGLFCRNLAFWTCDWQYLVCVVTWSQEDSFCFCRVLGNRTKCEHSANSANSVKALYKRKVFPPPDVSARKPRERGAGFKRGGGGRGSRYRRRRIGADPASAPSAAWERGCVALLVRLRRGFVIFKSFRLWSPLRLLSVYTVLYQPPFLLQETSAPCFKIVLHDHTYTIIHGGSNACLVGKLKNRTKSIWRS